MRVRLRKALLMAALAIGPVSPAAGQVSSYAGACDASAADALDAEHFVVASDEDNTLRVYRRGQPAPVGVVDLAAFLGARRGQESDLEGAARIGERIYWIASHGRNARGKAQPGRQRFFATDVRPGKPPTLVPAGTAYRALLRDLVASPALARLRLDEAARRAPEADGGLNIEGLAATPQGTLLIGFRSPLAGSRALIVPLENPADVIGGMRARFGVPIEIDLGGRGIRDITRVDDGYIIVAGPTGDIGTFALYRWSGDAGSPAVPIAGVDLAGLHPEAVFTVPGTTSLQILSDDGGVAVGGGPQCKTLPEAQRSFRSVTITP